MKTSLRILITEDDKYFSLFLREILSPYGLTDLAQDWPTAEKLLHSNHYDLIVTDLNLPGGPDGLRVLELAKKQHASRIMITSSEDEELIKKAYRMGAEHVLSKSQVRIHLPEFVKNLLQKNDFNRVDEVFRNRFPTNDEKLKKDISSLLNVPWSGRSLLITGPTGTGKSVLGKILAEKIFGSDAPFVHLNCSEIPDNLIESELFGHEKGAFTGADHKRIGKIKMADGGVLFLDEVATMSPSMQQKLLKAIEEKSFYPVGSSKLEKSAFTLICATCEDLPRKVSLGQFREDLLFRISSLKLHIPPLSERKKDIETFAKLFQSQIPRRIVIENEAFEVLKTSRWPGNLRELKQTIMSLADTVNGVVTADTVRYQLNWGQEAVEHPRGLFNETIKQYILENGLRSYFQEIEREIAKDSIQRHQGKITSCIKELKISSSAFYRILQEHQILK